MRFFRNRIFGLAIYAVGITLVFLYVLFPSDLVLQQLTKSAYRAGWVLKAGSLHPSLPSGIKLKNLSVYATPAPTDALFQGESLDLQFGPASFFRKLKTINFHGRAYGGDFDGSAGFSDLLLAKLPTRGKIEFQNIDLARYNPTGVSPFRGMTGRVRGSAFYMTDDAASANPIGKMSLYLGRGSYPLPEPFLGLNRIEFDRGEIQAQLKNGVVTLEKLEISGVQVSCRLSGDIQMAPRVEESRLNLKGVLEISGKNKVRMNVTVGGTLAQPSFRYI